MKEFQTPQKEISRFSDLANRKSHLKKPQKIAKKSLNAAFSSISEDASSEITELSPISEISSDNLVNQISTSSVLELNSALSSSSETSPPSDLSPASKITAISEERCEFNEKPGGSTTGSLVEADIVANLLKQARSQILNSDDVDFRSKKVLDALIKVVIEEFYTLPQERDRFDELVSMKGRIVLLCFLLWSFVMSLVFFFGVGYDSSYSGPSPI